MRRVNSIELFDEDRQIVVAQNFSLPQLDGSQLTGLVSKINNKWGNIQIVAGSGLVTISNNNDKQIAIDVDIPNIASLFVQLNGTNVVADTYSITYNKTKYLVTVKHNLNSRVVGFLFDENDKQAFYGVDYVDNNTISIQFESTTFPSQDNVWKLSLGLGGGLPITLSTQMPSIESTDATVTSSIAVYNFVKQQISVLNEQFEEFKTNTTNQFQIVDENFETVSDQFVKVREQFAQQDTLLNNKIDVQIQRINEIVVDINNMMKQMSGLLDEINGVKSIYFITVSRSQTETEEKFLRSEQQDVEIIVDEQTRIYYAWIKEGQENYYVYSEQEQPETNSIVLGVGENNEILTNENIEDIYEYGSVLTLGKEYE